MPTHTGPDGAARNSEWDPAVLRWAVGAAGLTLAVVPAIAQRAVVFGSVAGGWVYPYFRPFSLSVLLPLAGIIVALPLLRLGARQVERRESAVVCLAIAVGFLLQLIMRAAAFASLGRIVVSDQANGFYSPTLHINAWQFLSRHAAMLESLPAHARTNMPGKVMFFYLLELFTRSQQVLGVLVVLTSTIAGGFVYLVARELTNDRRAALFALALYLVVPGRVAFLPIVNTVTPLPVFLSLWLFMYGLRTGSRPAALGVGASIYVLVFFEPLPLVMGLVFAACFVGAWMRGERRPRELWMQVLLAAAAFIIVHLLMRVVCGYDIFDNFGYVLRDARAFNQRAARPYNVWLLANLKEFALGSGLASIAMAVGAFIAATRDRTTALAGFVFATVAVLLVLLLAGVDRGEVTRLWLFLASAVAIVAGAFLGRSRSFTPVAIVFLAVGCQAVVQTGMVAFVIP